jgi:acetoin utilization protein AcuC
MCQTAVFFGDALARYGFGNLHPWHFNRIFDFWSKFKNENLNISAQVIIKDPVSADEESILTFHERDYVDLVKKSSRVGSGFLDFGDTPVFKGIFEASSNVVGTTVECLNLVMKSPPEVEHVFNPIGGLHHARRDSAAGFCVFNDIGIAIRIARKRYGVKRIAYVDIDAHHGDGVYYEFENDPLLFMADIHEDGRFLYPGTGSRLECGIGEAKGTKLNIPMEPKSTDKDFILAFNRIENFIEDLAKPELIILQCGADSLDGDPIAHLRYTPIAHRYATDVLHRLAHKYAKGRLVALGGGGYNSSNIANAWIEVVKSMISKPL